MSGAGRQPRNLVLVESREDLCHHRPGNADKAITFSEPSKIGIFSQKTGNQSVQCKALPIGLHFKHFEQVSVQAKTTGKAPFLQSHKSQLRWRWHFFYFSLQGRSAVLRTLTGHGFYRVQSIATQSVAKYQGGECVCYKTLIVYQVMWVALTSIVERTAVDSSAKGPKKAHRATRHSNNGHHVLRGNSNRFNHDLPVAVRC